MKPYRGVVTGCNDAFLVDTATKEAIVKRDPNAAGIIKPYLRGQDVERWQSEWAELWMIFARRGIDIDAYPGIKEYLLRFRPELEPKPAGWTGDKWPGRKAGSYQWFEIQDPIEYWKEYGEPKIVYQEIPVSPALCSRHGGPVWEQQDIFCRFRRSVPFGRS